LPRNGAVQPDLAEVQGSQINHNQDIVTLQVRIQVPEKVLGDVVENNAKVYASQHQVFLVSQDEFQRKLEQMASHTQAFVKDVPCLLIDDGYY
jgi:hypothetical protein